MSECVKVHTYSLYKCQFIKSLDYCFLLTYTLLEVVYLRGADTAGEKDPYMEQTGLQDCPTKYIHILYMSNSLANTSASWFGQDQLRQMNFRTVGVRDKGKIIRNRGNILFVTKSIILRDETLWAKDITNREWMYTEQWTVYRRKTGVPPAVLLTVHHPQADYKFTTHAFDTSFKPLTAKGLADVVSQRDARRYATHWLQK